MNFQLQCFRHVIFGAYGDKNELRIRPDNNMNSTGEKGGIPISEQNQTKFLDRGKCLSVF